MSLFFNNKLLFNTRLAEIRPILASKGRKQVSKIRKKARQKRNKNPSIKELLSLIGDKKLIELLLKILNFDKNNRSSKETGAKSKKPPRKMKLAGATGRGRGSGLGKSQPLKNSIRVLQTPPKRKDETSKEYFKRKRQDDILNAVAQNSNLGYVAQSIFKDTDLSNRLQSFSQASPKQQSKLEAKLIKDLKERAKTINLESLDPFEEAQQAKEDLDKFKNRYNKVLGESVVSGLDDDSDDDNWEVFVSSKTRDTKTIDLGELPETTSLKQFEEARKGLQKSLKVKMPQPEEDLSISEIYDNKPDEGTSFSVNFGDSDETTDEDANIKVSSFLKAQKEGKSWNQIKIGTI